MQNNGSFIFIEWSQKKGVVSSSEVAILYETIELNCERTIVFLLMDVGRNASCEEEVY